MQFVIELEPEFTGGFVNESTGGVMATVNDLIQRIVAKATELLKDNMPPWDVVEPAIRLAYDVYVRPLSIPNFLDNMLCNALVREVKKVYDSLPA